MASFFWPGPLLHASEGGRGPCMAAEGEVGTGCPCAPVHFCSLRDWHRPSKIPSCEAHVSAAEFLGDGVGQAQALHAVGSTATGRCGAAGQQTGANCPLKVGHSPPWVGQQAPMLQGQEADGARTTGAATPAAAGCPPSPPAGDSGPYGKRPASPAASRSDDLGEPPPPPDSIGSAGATA